MDNNDFKKTDNLFDFSFSIKDNHPRIDFICNEDIYKEKQCFAIMRELKTNLGLFGFDFKCCKDAKYFFSSDGLIDNLGGVVFEVYDPYDNLVYRQNAYERNKEFLINKKLSSPSKDCNFFPYTEIFDTEVYNQQKKIKNGDVVVDFGANIGLYSLYAFSQGAKKVYSVEPSLLSYNHLDINLGDYKNRSNRFNMAVGNRDGYVEINCSDVHSTINSIVPSFCSEQRDNIKYVSKNIEIIDADRFFNEMVEEDVVDFLKIDIEGAEYDVLESISEDTLKNRIKNITMEHHFLKDKNNKDRFYTIIKKLERCGFNCDYDEHPTNGYLFAYKSKINLVHLLTTPSDKREQESITSLSQLKYFGINYLQSINAPEIEFPDRPTYYNHSDKSPGKWGNYKAFRDAIINYMESDFLILCECDCVLEVSCDFFVELVNRVCKIMKDRNIAMVSLGDSKDCKTGQSCSPILETLEESEFMYLTDNITCCHCIILNPNIKDFLISKFSEDKWDVIDLFFNKIFQDTNFKRGILNERVAFQCEGISLIDNEIKNHSIRYSETKPWMDNIYNDDIIIVNAFANTKKREIMLERLLKQLKKTGREIILSSHCSVSHSLQKLVNYFIYDSNNQMFPKDTGSQWWYKTDSFYFQNNFQNTNLHGYAAVTSFINGFIIAKMLGKKIAYHIEFDSVVSDVDLLKFGDIRRDILKNGKKGYLEIDKWTDLNGISMWFSVFDVDYLLDKLTIPRNASEFVKNSQLRNAETILYYNILPTDEEFIINRREKKITALPYSEADLSSCYDVIFRADIVVDKNNYNNKVLFFFNTKGAKSYDFYGVSHAGGRQKIGSLKKGIEAYFHVSVSRYERVEIISTDDHKMVFKKNIDEVEPLQNGYIEFFGDN